MELFQIRTSLEDDLSQYFLWVQSFVFVFEAYCPPSCEKNSFFPAAKPSGHRTVRVVVVVVVIVVGGGTTLGS